MFQLTSTNGTTNGNRILGADGKPWRDSPVNGDQFALPHVMQFSSVLGSAWKTFWHGKYDEALRNSREDALAMKRDCFLQSLLQERKLGTTSLKWHLEVDDEDDPQQKALADGLTKVLKNTPRLQRMLMYLLEALWYGRYAAQVVYEWKMLEVPSLVQMGTGEGKGGTEWRRCLCIKAHQPVNGDKIGHQWDGTPYILAHGAYADQLPNAETIITTAHKAVALTGTWRERFIIHTHEVEDADFFEAERAEAIHGVGIRSFIYWTEWLRKEWLGNVADWCERTGLGVRVWYYQGGNPSSQAAVEKAARDQTDRVNLLVPRYGDRAGIEGVEFVDTNGSGADLLLRLQEHVEEQEERFIVGQTLSSDSEGNGLGGSGVAALHAQTKAKIIAYDSGNLGETLTTDWLNPVKQWTYPEASHIPVRFVFDVQQPDPDKILDAVDKAAGIGAHFVEDEVVALTGLSVPREGDKVIGGKAPAPMPGEPGAKPPFGASASTDDNKDSVFGGDKKDTFGRKGSPARHSLDIHRVIDRLRQNGKGQEFAEAILGLLDRFPGMRMAMDGNDLATLEQWANGPQRHSREEMLEDLGRAAAITDRNPSDAQKAAGNYRKGKVNLHGMDISIENPQGGTRSGTSKDGTTWSVQMAHHYGYIRRTESEADGDHIDVFIGPHPESEIVFVIDQKKAGGSFDEHKCMLGFTNAEEAEKGYLANYSDGWTGLDGITAMTMDQFKDWIEDGDTSKPLAR